MTLISAYFNKGGVRAVTEQTNVYRVMNERVGVIGEISATARQLNNNDD
jgi:predicted site-specific integrase-resolvase